MTEVLLGILSFIVLTLTILQGWQMRQRRNSNPNNLISKLDDVISKLDAIVARSGRMEQRLNDIWDKVKRD